MQQPSNTTVRKPCLATEWPLLAVGGINDLLQEVQSGSWALIVVDTLSSFLGGVDQNDLAQVVPPLGQLQQATLAAGGCVLFVDHHRKSTGFESDPVNDILGSTGKGAVFDTILGLYRNQGRRETTLKAVGRDIDESELLLQWGGLPLGWQSLGDAGEVRADSFRGEVLAAARQLDDDGELILASRIAKVTGKDLSNVNKALADLVAAHKLQPLSRVGNRQPYGLTE